MSRQESGRIPYEAREAGPAALNNDKDWHKPDSGGVWRANYHRAVELVLEAAAPLLQSREACGKAGPHGHGPCVFTPSHHDGFHNGGEWTSHADRGGWTWNDQPTEEGGES